MQSPAISTFFPGFLARVMALVYAFSEEAIWQPVGVNGCVNGCLFYTLVLATSPTSWLKEAGIGSNSHWRPDPCVCMWWQHLDIHADKPLLHECIIPNIKFRLEISSDNVGQNSFFWPHRHVWHVLLMNFNKLSNHVVLLSSFEDSVLCKMWCAFFSLVNVSVGHFSTPGCV